MKLTEIINGFNGNIRGYRLNQVYVLSPYISRHFFDELNTFDPEDILIVTDAGISGNVIREVRELINARLKVRFAQCSGIVHAKAYLFRWLNNDGGMKTLFLWGSCNASDGGFGRNAEIYSWMPLGAISDREQRKELISYFNRLRNEEHVGSIQILINNDIIIRLPDLSFINPDEESTFDLWLQKGFLCHPFLNDTRFRHFKLQLRSKIGKNDEVVKIFENNMLSSTQQTSISYDYLRYGRESKRVNVFVNRNWKAQYFTDTNYGLWTSSECFKEKENYFGRQEEDWMQRRDEIEAISNAEEFQKREWIDNFLKLLKKISEDIKAIRGLVHYFECNEHDFIDEAYYKEYFLKQLNKDIIRSNDKWFENCYITGFEFVEVPPLKNFSKHWDSFVLSFCNTLLSNIKISKLNKLSRTLGSIGEFDEVVDDIDNGKHLLDWLRENWKKHESTIRGFYLRK